MAATTNAVTMASQTWFVNTLANTRRRSAPLPYISVFVYLISPQMKMEKAPLLDRRGVAEAASALTLPAAMKLSREAE
jgi:hypothetical protein